MSIAKKIISISLVIMILSVLFIGNNVNAASKNTPAKVKNVKYSLTVKKSNVKFGRWYVYEKNAKLSWSKVDGAIGYEIYINRNNEEKWTERTTSTSFKLPTHTAHGLGAQSNIYPYFTVKVRAYKVVNGRYSYGDWSNTKIIWM